MLNQHSEFQKFLERDEKLTLYKGFTEEQGEESINEQARNQIAPMQEGMPNDIGDVSEAR